MEKNFILSTQKTMKSENKSFAQRLAETETIIGLADIFSSVMGEVITPNQTLVILNALTAFTMLFLPVEMPFIARIFCLTWFALSLLHCKIKGLK